MKMLLIILALSFGVTAFAGTCNYKAKGVQLPMPQIASTVVMEDKWHEAFADVWNVLCYNLKTPGPFYRGYRSHPGPPYKAAYLWDTAFISQVWLHWDPKIAEELIHYILKFQKNDGMIHHAVLELVVKPLPYSNSQPPLLAWSAWRIYQKSQNKEFLKTVYPKLKLFHQWMMKERQHPDGLFFWKHPYESGIDNSPRFSNRDESKFEDTTKMAAVDLSSYMALSMEALGHIARELGLTSELEQYSEQYTKLQLVMNTKLWDKQRGMYFDWDYKNNQFIHYETISNLTPMVAGIPSREQAKIMMTKIVDPNYYNTTIPFPSVARNEPSFQKDMWRGPVWINMAYLGVLGVKRYGHTNEAAYLARKIVKGVFETWKNNRFFYEFYDPDRFDIVELHRKKGNLWKKITLGSKPVKNFVGWTGLVNNLLIEFGADFPKPYPKATLDELAPKELQLLKPSEDPVDSVLKTTKL